MVNVGHSKKPKSNSVENVLQLLTSQPGSEREKFCVPHLNMQKKLGHQEPDKAQIFKA